MCFFDDITTYSHKVGTGSLVLPKLDVMGLGVKIRYLLDSQVIKAVLVVRCKFTGANKIWRLQWIATWIFDDVAGLRLSLIFDCDY